MEIDELVRLEHEGWRALSTSGAAAHDFYDRVLDDEPLMLLPGGLVLDDRAGMIEAMSGQPWASYRLSSLRCQQLADTAALLTYEARARRGEADYAALVSSVYKRNGDAWRLAFHQQTPTTVEHA